MERLNAALAADGWMTQTEVRVLGPESPHAVDTIARKGSQTYVIELKAARDGRSVTLTSLAAAGLLQARKFASLVPGTPMVVVGAPRLSPSLVEALRQFIADFGDGAPWGVVDDSGLLELHGPDLGGVKAVSGPRQKAPRGAALSTRRGQSDPFSDLSQWCLKVLLSHLLPTGLQLVSHGLHVGQPVRNSNELAKIANVSAPTAWRTVRTLQQDDLLSRSEPLEPLRIAALMTRWQAVNLRQWPDIRARWLFPSKASALERLSDELRVPGAWHDTHGPRLALGLFAAADILGYSFVRGVAPHLLHEDPSPRELERLGLTAAGPGERVDVFLRKPRFPAAAFRGVTAIHGIPVADIFQVWLDVSGYPARGQEMADHLASRALSHVFSPADEVLLVDEETP